MSDLINRQDAIDAIEAKEANEFGNYREYNVAFNDGLLSAVFVLEDLSSAERKGHWIKHHTNGIEDLECSECGCWFLHDHLVRNSYCPNCGARMVSE